MMKKFAFPLTLLCVCSLCLTSCSDDKDEPTDKTTAAEILGRTQGKYWTAIDTKVINDNILYTLPQAYAKNIIPNDLMLLNAIYFQDNAFRCYTTKISTVYTDMQLHKTNGLTLTFNQDALYPRMTLESGDDNTLTLEYTSSQIHNDKLRICTTFTPASEMQIELLKGAKPLE